MKPGFISRLEARVAATGSLLCVGLDPRVTSPLRARQHCLEVIEATRRHAVAFKPNTAFFEELGPSGMEVLAEVVAAIPEEIPVLLDAKRGDISTTAAAYATAVFDRIGAGAVTVSPYLGRDSIEPFLEHEGRAVFVLCRTSNPGGSDFQERRLAPGGTTLYEEVARTSIRWAGPDRLGLVVGATMPEAVARVRAVAPDHWILAPGVGPQGGSLQETLAAGLRPDGMGVLLPVSRAIAGAPDRAAAAAEFCAAVTGVRGTAGAAPAAPSDTLAIDLFDAGCVRFGDFELKSGRRSPIYLDLRNLAGHPDLMRRIARRYLPLLGRAVPLSDSAPSSTSQHDAGDAFARLAGVPLAGLPIATAVSLESGIPMVYPRSGVKTHGTRAAIEGPFRRGERVVVIDDVATSGISVLDAVERLRGAGLDVGVAVVLIDRGGRAAEALADEGVELRAVTGLGDIVESLCTGGRITDTEADRVREFLRA